MPQINMDLCIFPNKNPELSFLSGFHANIISGFYYKDESNKFKVCLQTSINDLKLIIIDEIKLRFKYHPNIHQKIKYLEDKLYCHDNIEKIIIQSLENKNKPVIYFYLQE